MEPEKTQQPVSPRTETKTEVAPEASAPSVEKPKENAPKEAKVTKSQEPEKTQENSNKEQGSGWGTWSNWWSTATTAVTHSVSSLTETTTQLVKELVNEEPQQPVKLYRREEDIKADEASKKEEEKVEKEKLEQKVHEQRMVKELPDGKQEEPKEGDLDILSVVDKGFTMIGDGVDKLGNFFGQGINKVVESAPEFQAKAKDFASHGIEMAMQTAEKGRKVGEKLATQGVDALETVGKHALTYLTVQEEVEGSKKRLRPVFIYNSTPATHMTKEELASFEDSLNRNYFDESNGTAFMQELEKISIECTLKFQKLEQKIAKADPKLREELTALLNKVKEVFETEEDSEKALNVQDVPLNEVATKHREALDGLAKLAHTRAKEVIDGFKQEMKEFKPEENSSTILTATDICHLTASYMDKTLLESVSRLNQFSANTVEQILRIVESYLIEFETAKLEKDDFMKRVEYIFFISQILIEEITNISNAFIDSIKSLGEEAKANFAEYSNKGDAEKEETNKCAEDIDTKMNLHVNHIYLDTSNAVSNVEDCRRFLFPITKSLAGNTIQLPKEETQ